MPGLKENKELIYPIGAWEYHSGMKLIENNDKKPLRIFIHVSENDLRSDAPPEKHHNWVLANKRMADALFLKGYDYRFLYSLDVWTVGGLDPTDFVSLYKLIDGGKEELIGTLSSSHNDGAKIEDEAKGEKLKLIIRANVSAPDEVYYMDNLMVVYKK